MQICYTMLLLTSFLLPYSQTLPNKHTITKISDKLWDKISTILSDEKPDNTIGRPIVPYKKVMDGIIYVLRTGCQWKMRPKEYGSGSTCHRRLQEWVRLDIFKKIWITLLKEYDCKKVSNGYDNHLTVYL